MFHTETIKQILLEQREIFLHIDQAIDRDILHKSDFLRICELKEAVIITGVRRCGKSYLLKLIWKKIQEESDVPPNNFLYVNFETEKMLDFSAKHFDKLLEIWQELLSPEITKKRYLFFDEIQNIPHWEKFINRLLETNSYKIFITGSNASLLSKEIGTALTGRNFPLRLYPLSFHEFYRYKTQREWEKNDIYQREEKIQAKQLFTDFLNLGGFPEVVKNNFRPLLEEYLRNIIYRDIVLRHRIKYEASLREIVFFLTSNIGTPLSLEKISKMTKVKSIMTVKKYLSYLEDSFVFSFVPRQSFSIKQQIYNPDKSYLCDIGLYNEINLSPGENIGRAIENMVFNELKRREYGVYYFSSQHTECDFILQKKNKIVGAIQVSKEMQQMNKDREIQGLITAMDEYCLKEGVILTMDKEETFKVNGKNIHILPLFQWTMNES